MAEYLHFNVVVNGLSQVNHASVSSEVELFYFALGGKTPIHSILIANNGMASVKFMHNIRTWAYETYRSKKAILLIAMATPEELRINAEHIRIADQFVEVHIETNNNSYANVHLIVEMAEITHDSIVWPGWGHASKNLELPDDLKAKGIIFLRPPAAPMLALGDKIRSSLIAQAIGVPTLPWSGSHVYTLNFTLTLLYLRQSYYSLWHFYTLSGALLALQVNISVANSLDSISDDIYHEACVYTTEEALASCQVVGYPAMIKASWGGGGKGIRKVFSYPVLNYYMSELLIKIY